MEYEKSQSVLSFRELINNTPLVHLPTISQDCGFSVYAKLEMQNIGGSMKDRAAFSMIEAALKAGHVREGSTVIESSSGNMGIGLAIACKVYGLRFVCVVDARTNTTNMQLMEAYGAQVVCIEKAPHGKSLLVARREYVAKFLEKNPDCYWPNQYGNEFNHKAHEQTMKEIATALNNKVDYVLCAVGTCGTIRGCADYIKRSGLRTKIIAIDAVGSVIYGGESGDRLIPGHGAAVRPDIFRENMASKALHMTDADCVHGCDLLLAKENILAGGSSGAVIAGLLKYAPQIENDANVVVILADRGERYLHTIYNDQWRNQYLK